MSSSFHGDPIGIFVARRGTPEFYEMESNEVLKK